MSETELKLFLTHHEAGAVLPRMAGYQCDAGMMFRGFQSFAEGRSTGMQSSSDWTQRFL